MIVSPTYYTFPENKPHYFPRNTPVCLEVTMLTHSQYLQNRYCLKVCLLLLFLLCSNRNQHKILFLAVAKRIERKERHRSNDLLQMKCCSFILNTLRKNISCIKNENNNRQFESLESVPRIYE